MPAFVRDAVAHLAPGGLLLASLLACSSASNGATLWAVGGGVAPALAAWDALFYPAEVEVLRPIIEGDGLLQLMQKNVPAERIQALLNKLETQRQA